MSSSTADSLFALGLTVAVAAAVAIISRHRRRGAKHNSNSLTLVDKIRLIVGLIRFRLTWGHHESTKEPAACLQSDTSVDRAVIAAVRHNRKFMTARAAAQLIPSNSVVCSCGFPVSERCTALMFAIKEQFSETSTPSNLTWIAVGAQGARGRAPGSIEELDAPGLISKFITGHLETVKSLLRAAARGTLQLYNLPQGTLAQLVEAQAKGVYTLQSTVGLGTVFDPRVGHAGKVNAVCCDSFITLADASEDAVGGLVYEIPKISVAIFNCRYADTDGNVYCDQNTTLTETTDAVAAARRHGGVVLATVQSVILVQEARRRSVSSDLTVRAADVDAIVVFNVGIAQDRLGIRAALQPQSRADVPKVWDSLRFVNRFLKLTPHRTAADHALGRLASVHYLRSFDECDIGCARIGSVGVGLPEEVSQNLFLQNVCESEGITLTTETGTMGGLPAMGMFFGTAIAPRRLLTSGAMFNMWKEQLQTACLGAIEVDELGNVNVSRHGDSIMQVVGSGGFPNLTDSARVIIFMCAWFAHGSMRVDPVSGAVSIMRRGRPKFVRRVREITFCGSTALALGKKVLYCTHVGVFELTEERGLLLVEVMPGIDVQRDILDATPCRINVSADLRVVPTQVMTGSGFHLGAYRTPK